MSVCARRCERIINNTHTKTLQQSERASKLLKSGRSRGDQIACTLLSGCRRNEIGGNGGGGGGGTAGNAGNAGAAPVSPSESVVVAVVFSLSLDDTTRRSQRQKVRQTSIGTRLLLLHCQSVVVVAVVVAEWCMQWSSLTHMYYH